MNGVMGTRLEITDVTKIPAVKGDYPGPFKRIRYEVQNDGRIILSIVKDLDLINYDLNFAKVVSQLREVEIRIYQFIDLPGGIKKEVLVRSLEANFINYLLDERPDIGGETIREEIINWEIKEIL